jgi:hypothetical protein
MFVNGTKGVCHTITFQDIPVERHVFAVGRCQRVARNDRYGNSLTSIRIVLPVSHVWNEFLNLGGNRAGLASGRWRPDRLIGNNESLPKAEFGG